MMRVLCTAVFAGVLVGGVVFADGTAKTGGGSSRATSDGGTKPAPMPSLLEVAAAASGPVPFKIWWSFPNDDETAIEVDNADLTESPWDGARGRFAIAMQKCDFKKSKILAHHPDETPVREIRVVSLQPDGKVRSTMRCVMTLKDWRTRIGKNLVYRLDDELDAHAAFLLPRRGPGMPAKTEIAPDGSSHDAPRPDGAHIKK